MNTSVAGVPTTDTRPTRGGATPGTKITLAPAANVDSRGVPPSMHRAIKAHESGGGLGFPPDDPEEVSLGRRFPALNGEGA